jgi:hypothetical protein
MRKKLFYGLVFMLLFSCKQDRSAVTEDTSAFDISTENWPEKSKVNTKANTILKAWSEFVDLDKTFDGLYTVENTEDLSLIVEDLIETQKYMAESDYPESFDKPQIRSRQKVFQTFILKTKGDLEYRVDPQQSVREMIDAYNALRNQFQIITNNTLDIKKLLEE